MWATAPPLPAGAGALLDHHFQGRHAQFPAAPAPRWEGLARTVLAGGPQCPRGGRPTLRGVPPWPPLLH
eukprot:10888498-Alexandrium_andersonii.AAC.1